MRNALLHWALSALAIWIVSQLVPGFAIADATSALLAALVIGFINGTLGFFLKLMTLPLGLITFGLFFLVINALMLMLADNLLSGFDVSGFGAAFIGAIVLAIANMGLRALVGKKD